MFAYGIFKVIYAPHKAFKEIIQNPRYMGPFLIMLLFVLANIGFSYALLSKSYLDQTMPLPSELDKWTEDSTFWNSNAIIALNTNDYINGNYYGNKSIEFHLATGSQAWMQLNTSTSLNCSGPEGYKSLSFRLKLIEPSSKPSNGSLYMLSTQLQDNFYNNLTDKLNETSLWSNISISLGPGWTPSNADADWGNITGLRFEFTWSIDSNITLLIDGLFFHGVYKPAIQSSSGDLFYYPINAFMQFTIQWVVLGGLLYIIPKIFKAKTIWKSLLAIAGFALITLFIQIVIFTAVLSAWPELRFGFEVLGGVPGEWQTAYAQVFGPISTVFWYVEKAMYIWTIALCTIAIHLMFKFSWTKSLLVSTSSYLLSLLLFRFLVYGTIWL